MIDLTIENLRALTEETMRSLNFVFFNQVTPLLCIDKNLLGANFSKLELRFPNRITPWEIRI